ncbi:DUF3810 domain-containing protein [Clostridiaceae bacterium 35-E11]
MIKRLRLSFKNKKLFYILFLPIALLLSYYASYVPQFIESIYSKGIYLFIGQLLSLITGLLPISIAEWLIVFVCLFFIIKLFIMIAKSTKASMLKEYKVLDFFSNLMIFISLGYFCFIMIWGLNYHRLPFGNITGLDTKSSSVHELKALCEDLIHRTHQLRTALAEDKNGVMHIPHGPSSVFKRASIGYMEAAQDYAVLDGRYGQPKGVFFSKFMSYAGISGIYFPFTAEANVNTLVPDFMLPSTTCHEMAHQRGFAREDEANYIAYLTCNLHPDIDFQYSGTLLGLIHAMNALYTHDPVAYHQLYAAYHEGVKRDLAALTEFWHQYEGPIERFSSELNNAYLKSNMQRDGIYSYGRMVDLLIAEYRLKHTFKETPNL